MKIAYSLKSDKNKKKTRLNIRNWGLEKNKKKKMQIIKTKKKQKTCDDE